MLAGRQATRIMLTAGIRNHDDLIGVLNGRMASR
jgi:hypothetical protein